MVHVIFEVCSITSILPESLDVGIRGRPKYIMRDSLTLSDLDGRHLEIQTKLILVRTKLVNVALSGRSSQLRIYIDTTLSRFSVTEVLGRSAVVKCHETLDNTYL